MAKQLTFNQPHTCTHIYPDGKSERVRYGYYESIKIVSENGWPVDRCKPLIVPYNLVEEVVKEDGTKVIFDNPFFCISEREFGDGSGRIAKQR